MMFQGSSPTAWRTTPTRIDNRINRTATESGDPPKKRWTVSLLIPGSPRLAFLSQSIAHGSSPNPPLARLCARAPGLDRRQHRFEGLDPIRLCRRFVPAQPVDAGKAHRNSGLVTRRAPEAL